MTALLIGLGGAIATVLMCLWLLPKWLESREDARKRQAEARVLEQTSGHTTPQSVTDNEA